MMPYMHSLGIYRADMAGQLLGVAAEKVGKAYESALSSLLTVVGGLRQKILRFKHGCETDLKISSRPLEARRLTKLQGVHHVPHTRA